MIVGVKSEKPDIAPTQDAKTVPKGDQQLIGMEVLDSNEVERGKFLRESDLDIIDASSNDGPEKREPNFGRKSCSSLESLPNDTDQDEDEASDGEGLTPGQLAEHKKSKT